MAVPIFSYLFHISPITTTAYSLFVVGTSASVGTYQNLKKGLVDIKIALVFAIPAFVAVYIVRKFALPILPEELFLIKDFSITRDLTIMVFFAVVLLLASIAMIREKGIAIDRNPPTSCSNTVLPILGLIVGIITGIVGVGGGFLIIPVLVLCAKMPMTKAVATSLLIIALKSLIGFTGELGNLDIDWIFLLSFTVVSMLGIAIGIYLSNFINGQKLKKAFGWFALSIAIFIFYNELLT